MKKVPIIIWPIVGICILLSIVAFFILRVSHIPMVSLTTPTLIPGESLKISDVKYNNDYENGQGGWELIAKEAHLFDTTQIVSLKDVVLKLDSLKDNSYTIKGDEGNYCRKTEEIVLKGNVVGRSERGYQIETTLLIYRQKDGSIVTDKPILLNGPFFRVKGDSLYLDLTSNRFKVKRNVYTTISGGDFYR